MESTRLSYKQDDHGNAMYAKVCWSTAENSSPKPIALVYHGGGLIVGSSEIIPKTQIEYLTGQNFLVVIPNYRLAPQVDAKTSFADAEEAYEWAISGLPEVLKSIHALQIDAENVVAMGHSSGGTLALHMAATKNVKAITAFYPSLYLSDENTSSHQPTSEPPFGAFPDYEPTDEDWEAIKPSDVQLSEAPLAIPGGPPPQPRNRWQMHILKHGEWAKTVLPEGDYAAVDPLTRLTSGWPPVMFVQGDQDRVPGSSLDLVRRAEKEMRAVGMEEVEVEVVAGASHMFDLPPTVGASDKGPMWEAVVKGLDWLKSHV